MLSVATFVMDADSGDNGRQAINLEALSHLKGVDLDSNPALKSVVLKILDQARGTPAFVDIVRELKLKDQSPALLDLVVKDPSGAAGVEAMRLLLSSEPAGLKQPLASTNAPAIIEALGNTGEKQIVPLLKPLLVDPTPPMDLRERALRALVKSKDGAATVLELAKSKNLPDELRSTAGVELSRVPWDNLRAQAAELTSSTTKQNAQPLPPINELVKRSGDAQRGAAVFRRDTVGCLKCHQINGEGTDFGPNLSEIGTKLAKQAIYESILDPSAGIAFGYEAWDIELKDGDDAIGLIVSETADELALKTVGGIVRRYKKAEITRRTKQKLSIMPAGLQQTMSTDDLVDLVEYLSSLKKAK